MSRKIGFELESALFQGNNQFFFENSPIEKEVRREGDIDGISYVFFYSPLYRVFEIVVNPLDSIDNLDDVLPEAYEIATTNPSPNKKIRDDPAFNMNGEYGLKVESFDLSLEVLLPELGLTEKQFSELYDRNVEGMELLQGSKMVVGNEILHEALIDMSMHYYSFFDYRMARLRKIEEDYVMELKFWHYNNWGRPCMDNLDELRGYMVDVYQRIEPCLVQ